MSILGILYSAILVINGQRRMHGSRDSLLVRAPRLVIEKLQVRIRAKAAIEFSSLELIWCADSYLASAPLPCYRRDTQTTPVILPKVEVAGYT